MRPVLTTLVGASIALAALASPGSAATPDQLRQSVGRSLAILQKSQAVFERQATCASCHNQVQPMVATVAARDKGVSFDEAIFKRQLASVVGTVGLRKDTGLVHGVGAGAHAVVGSLMSGLVEAKVPADENTDAAVIFLMAKQAPGGEWKTLGVRFPFGTSEFGVTSTAVRAIDAYAPPSLRKQADASIAKARTWLVATPASKDDTQAMLHRLQGLTWAKAPAAAVARARNDLVGIQKSDGGWAQTSTLAGDAYATAEVLVALHDSGMKPQDPVYQRGLDYLLRTQRPDGSWYVKSRALPIQPPIDGGFPYGVDQWISAWSTALAATAMAYAL